MINWQIDIVLPIQIIGILAENTYNLKCVPNWSCKYLFLSYQPLMFIHQTTVSFKERNFTKQTACTRGAARSAQMQI